MRALGIDLGDRRIGLAVSDPTGVLARPLQVIERTASDRHAVDLLVQVIGRLAAEADSLAVIVVGYPRRLDGSSNEQTARVETMVAALAGRTTIPVVLQDERLSSREAEARLSLRHRDWRVRKKKLDAAAAAIILQDYLDGQAGYGSAGGNGPDGHDGIDEDQG
jgi:putative Holliday junction resolvase